jgi:NADPH:quinone reductase-like Zn-dependent oxidoreductase
MRQVSTEYGDSHTTSQEATARMKAIQFKEYGGPEVLRLVDVELPEPGEGEIRIEVSAAGINGVDYKIRAGYLADFMPTVFPSGTGIDASGVVSSLGPGVQGISVGDRVFGNGRNTVAESAILTSWAQIPDDLSFEEAAGYPVAVETARRLLNAVNLTAGQTILVSGASGGVGSAVVQLATQRGLNVIGTASAPNHPYVRDRGATAITYGEDLVDRVRAVAPEGIDAAFDIAGSGVLKELIELTGDPSRVVTIADFSGAELGVQMSTSSTDFPGALAEAIELFSAGKFSIPVAREFTLEQAAQAHESCAMGHIAGRIVASVR